jgi:hypothetical protein
MKGVLGIVERVKVCGIREREVLALVDTGARLTSVDIKIAAETEIGPVVRSAKIRSASASDTSKRPVLQARIEVGGKKFVTEVNVADRSKMAFPVLIGRNVLRGNFVVDVEKNADVLAKIAKEKRMYQELV